MPCGGIWPIKRPGTEKNPAAWADGKHPGDRGRGNYGCYMCGKPCFPSKKAAAGTPEHLLPDFFIDEWDAYIHSECVPSFLQTEEGRIVLEHGHEVAIWKDGKIVILHEEKS